MDLLETRELRYFVAVADERHFGRAAAALRIAQPALSRAIQRLEVRLGVQLLVRSSRMVALTPAGEALLTSSRTAIGAVIAAAESAQRAAEGQHLRLVIKPGGDANLLSGILAAYARTPDARPVDVLFSSGMDRSDYLRVGRADLALMYLPWDDASDLITHDLLTEGRVVLLPKRHALAGHKSVRTEDLTSETILGSGNRTETSSTAPVAELGELISLVRLGRGVCVLPRSLVTEDLDGVRVIPVSDAEQSRIVIARRRDERDASVLALYQAAAKRFF